MKVKPYISLRDDIQKKAREYIGTPFVRQGRVKGVAMDCAGLPLCIAEEFGWNDREGAPFKSTDGPNYARQFAGKAAFDECARRLIQRPNGSMPEPGDVVLLVSPDDPVHLAIATDLRGQIGLVQALQVKLAKEKGSGRVVEHRVDEIWRKRIHSVFKFSAVAESEKV